MTPQHPQSEQYGVMLVMIVIAIIAWSFAGWHMLQLGLEAMQAFR